MTITRLLDGNRKNNRSNPVTSNRFFSMFAVLSLYISHDRARGSRVHGPGKFSVAVRIRN